MNSLLTGGALALMVTLVARTFRTLSLSLPPDVVLRLEQIGVGHGKTAARVAAEAVLRSISVPNDVLEAPLQEKGDSSMLLHQCVVHERTARGVFSRQYQTICLLDVTRIRGGRADVLEIHLGGEWIEIEGKFDEFQTIWVRAKGMGALPD